MKANAIFEYKSPRVEISELFLSNVTRVPSRKKKEAIRSLRRYDRATDAIGKAIAKYAIHMVETRSPLEFLTDGVATTSEFTWKTT